MGREQPCKTDKVRIKLSPESPITALKTQEVLCDKAGKFNLGHNYTPGTCMSSSNIPTL